MEFRRLHYFVRVADDGSLTKASGVLRVAQPALSRQIRLLEEELGVCLFTRTAYGMQLTEEGEYLRSSIAGHLRAIELALQNVRSYASPIEGTFSIGMPQGIADTVATPLVERMEADFPNIRLRIIEGWTGSLINLLNRGIVDFALLDDASRDDRLSDHLLFSEKLVLVGANGSGLDAAQPMAFRDVARLPLIMPMHHLGIRSSINDAAVKARVTLNIRQEADAGRFVWDMVTAGKGYALLPPSQISGAQRGLVETCPVIDPDLPLTTSFSTRKNNRVAGGRIEGTILEIVEGIFRHQR